MKYWILFIVLFVSACQAPNRDSQGKSFTSKVDQLNVDSQNDSTLLIFFDRPRTPIPDRFQALPAGSVFPKGWILDMMENDLESGMVGALDELFPSMVKDDLYHTARRGGMEDIPDMGDLVLTGADWEQSILWWNAETVGNWWDGFIRHAFLTNDEAAIEQAQSIVQNLLDSQDEDGYIGIYKSKLRYQHTGTNGELWAQTTAFRALLGYYEFTKDTVVLEAIEAAVQKTIQAYGAEGQDPFKLKNAFGGVTHGLMFTDVCETLYRITAKPLYQDYAVFLYRSFSTHNINRAFNDLRYPFLLDRDSLLEGHAVHTYEHIRSLVHAYQATGYPELENALDHLFHKLGFCFLPSGAALGNEWIAKQIADPDRTSSEYCALLELRNSYGSLIQKTGNIHYADEAEKLTYNAMLGFRNHEGTALAYGKPDNCILMDGQHHEAHESWADPRYKYSPTHSEPAVCCVPNYSRNLPYFLDQMWMRQADTLVAVLYGPSLLSTFVDGQPVQIEQLTNYPLSDTIRFRFHLSSPRAFSLMLRHPNWSETLDFNLPVGPSKAGYYQIHKVWEDQEELLVVFNQQTIRRKANNKETYIQRGPILYAYEISHKEEPIKTYGKSSFRDYYCFPTDTSFQHLQLKEIHDFVVARNQGSSFHGLKANLKATFFNTQTQSDQVISLVPMGKTVLRQVTFPTYPN
ncbi:MAG: beta-L-arabinofuranosidase domain-containing protein [Bacteroidota bacterium]